MECWSADEGDVDIVLRGIPPYFLLRGLVLPGQDLPSWGLFLHLEALVPFLHIFLMIPLCLWVICLWRVHHYYSAEGRGITHFLDQLPISGVKEDPVLCKELESDQEVVLAAVSDEHEGVQIHYSVEIEVQGYPMGDFLAGSAGVVSDGYGVVETCGFHSAVFDGFEGFFRITKDMSVCSGVS